MLAGQGPAIGRLSVTVRVTRAPPLEAAPVRVELDSARRRSGSGQVYAVSVAPLLAGEQRPGGCVEAEDADEETEPSRPVMCSPADAEL